MEANNTFKVLDSNGNKVGQVVEFSKIVDCVTVYRYEAYNLSDVEVYSGEEFLDACAVLRGERMRSTMR